MPRYVLRIWLPDRPGALGAVASRIGAVRGDLVGIDILERGGGRAIDELVVDLPDEDLVPLLITEVSQVDGVDVEDVRVSREVHDPRLDALEAAAVLVEQETAEALLDALVAHVRVDFEAEWAAVLDPSEAARPDAAATTGLLASAGEPPPSGWLAAFVAGSQSSEAVATGASGPDDVTCAPLGATGLAVVLGRRGRPFRARERRQLGALARVASTRWRDLASLSATFVHEPVPGTGS